MEQTKQFLTNILAVGFLAIGITGIVMMTFSLLGYAIFQDICLIRDLI